MGERTADEFLTLLAPHRTVLLAFARRALDSPGEAEDAFQSAVLETFRDYSRFVPGASFRAFVFAHLAHAVQNANRKRRPGTFGLEPPEDEGSGHDVIAQLERETAYEALLAEPDRVLGAVSDPLARALRALSEAEREAFLLHAVGELTCAEIASARGAPLGTILARLHRARARLRAQLTDLAVADGLLRRQGEGRGS